MLSYIIHNFKSKKIDFISRNRDKVFFMSTICKSFTYIDIYVIFNMQINKGDRYGL